MSDAARHPRVLELPRDEYGLATTSTAQRRLKELLPTFLSNTLADAGAERLVVDLDGSVEAAVGAAMAVDAVGADRVVGLVMPAGKAGEAAARDAEAVADVLDIEYRRLPLAPVVGAFRETMDAAGSPADDLVATEHAEARLRTVCAYYVSNTVDGIVVGTANRTERLLGSTTKYGETGADCFLFGDLYRTEIRAFAQGLDIPEGILDSQSSHGFETGTPSATRLEVPPETLDRLLRLHIDEGRAATEVADRLDVPAATVRRAKRWCAETRHKRHQPPKPSTDL